MTKQKLEDLIKNNLGEEYKHNIISVYIDPDDKSKTYVIVIHDKFDIVAELHFLESKSRNTVFRAKIFTANQFEIRNIADLIDDLERKDVK